MCDPVPFFIYLLPVRSQSLERCVLGSPFQNWIYQLVELSCDTIRSLEQGVNKVSRQLSFLDELSADDNVGSQFHTYGSTHNRDRILVALQQSKRFIPIGRHVLRICAFFLSGHECAPDLTSCRV